MGTNIYVAIEQRQADGWKCIHAETDIDWNPDVVAPLSTVSWQCYDVFGFLAGERGRAVNNAIAQRRGLPYDSTDEALDSIAPYSGDPSVGSGYGEWALSEPKTPNERSIACMAETERYGFSWVGLSELVEFDYDQEITSEEGAPSAYRQELGDRYFENLEALKAKADQGEIRLLFCFEG